MKRSIGAGIAVVAAVLLLVLFFNRNDFLPPGPDGNVPILEPDHLTLYSIEPDYYRRAGLSTAPPDADLFHDCPVFGKTRIDSPDDRRAIMWALQRGIKASDGIVAACFDPHHAIRIEHAGRTIDYVICFSCRQIAIYDGDAHLGAKTSSKYESVFDRYLSAAHVPLAPRK